MGPRAVSLVSALPGAASIDIAFAAVSQTYDVAVVGGGLVGLAAALQLSTARPSLRLAVVEKELELAAHQSGHNSGVIHAGLYYEPGSLKARLCREGAALLRSFADERGIPYRTRGKLVVAVDESEVGRLEELERRGRANGLVGLRALGPQEMREIEPHVAGVRALHVPESGVIDYRRVAAAYGETLRERGAEIMLGREVTAIARDTAAATLETTGGDVRACVVLTCAGLQADRVARLTGDGEPARYRIVPFRGDYFVLRPRAAALVRGLVYPVPDPSFPFLGVHFTRAVDDVVSVGPNAVLALAREGYHRTSLNVRDLRDTLTFPGFRRFARRHFATGVAEMWRDVAKSALVRQLQRYIPAITTSDVSLGGAGVRAQVMTPDGHLVDDFLVFESERAMHVLNAPSPAATASLAIGEMLATRAMERFDF